MHVEIGLEDRDLGFLKVLRIHEYSRVAGGLLLAQQRIELFVILVQLPQGVVNLRTVQGSVMVVPQVFRIVVLFRSPRVVLVVIQVVLTPGVRYQGDLTVERTHVGQEGRVRGALLGQARRGRRRPGYRGHPTVVLWRCSPFLETIYFFCHSMGIVEILDPH